MTVSLERLLSVGLALFVVSSGFVGGITPVTADDNLKVTLNTPSDATAGEETNLNASLDLRDVFPRKDPETTASASLYIDGELAASENVTITDGGVASVNFSHTFSKSGSGSVNIEASVSIGGRSFSASASDSIMIDPEDIGNLTIESEAPNRVIVNKTVPINASLALPNAVGRNASGNVSISVLSNGQVIGNRTIALTDGENQSVTLDASFEQTGEVTITIVANGSVGTESVSASTNKSIKVIQHPNISASITAPNVTTAGDNVSINGTTQIPELVINTTANATVTLSTDGETVASKTVSLQDGESRNVNYTTAFTQSGETNITLSVNGTIAGTPVSTSVSETIFISDTPNVTTQSGVAFVVPSSLEDEVDNYRDQLGTDADLQAFVLAQKDSVRIVFSQQEPQKGIATVQGATVNQTFEWRNLTFGGIIAEQVAFSTVGNNTTVPKVVNSTDDFQLELVRINATYRRVSTLTDTDGENEVTVVETPGILVEDPLTASAAFDRIGAQATRFTLNSSINQRGPKGQAELQRILNESQKPVLPTIEFEESFAADAPATVDGVVLSPGSVAQRFVRRTDQANLSPNNSTQPVLYVVNETFNPTPVANVSAAKSQSDGEVVSLSVRLLQGRLSVQESLEHNTGCGETLFPVQTPSGPTCVNIVQDVLIHGGAAFNSPPTSRDEVLLVSGLSSRELDEPYNMTTGQYRIVGEIVRTERIDPRLPNGSALIIYQLNRTDSIDYEQLANKSQTILENRTIELRDRLRDQLNATENAPPLSENGSASAGGSLAIVGPADATYDPVEPVIIGTNYNATGVINRSNIAIRLLNVTSGNSTVVAVNDSVPIAGSANITIPAGILSGNVTIEAQLYNNSSQQVVANDTVTLIAGESAAAGNGTYEITLDQSVDISERTLDISSNEFTISEVGRYADDETVDATTSGPANTTYAVRLVDSDERLRQSEYVTGDGSAEFSLDRLPVGTYTVMITNESDAEDIKTVARFVIYGYTVTQSTPSEVERDSTLDVRLRLIKVDRQADEPPAGVEVALGNDSTSIITTATRTSDLNYTAEINVSPLSTGEYSLYTGVQRNNTTYGQQELIGVNTYSVSVVESTSSATTSAPQVSPTETVSSEAPGFGTLITFLALFSATLLTLRRGNIQ